MRVCVCVCVSVVKCSTEGSGGTCGIFGGERRQRFWLSAGGWVGVGSGVGVGRRLDWVKGMWCWVIGRAWR